MHLMTTELIHALPVAERRVFNRDEAASYVGVSPGYFDNLVARGTMPKALPMGRVRRWDKAALDGALDRMSGLPPSEVGEPAAAYEAWRRTYGQG